MSGLIALGKTCTFYTSLPNKISLFNICKQKLKSDNYAINLKEKWGEKEIRQIEDKSQDGRS